VTTSARQRQAEYKAWKREYDRSRRESGVYKERAKELAPRWKKVINKWRCEHYRTNEGRIKALLRAAKWRANKKGLEFDLLPSDITIPKLCPVLGIPLDTALTKKTGGARSHWSSPSLDRLDNTKGYVRGNVRVISWRANALKKDATLEELLALVKYMSGGVS
jgi:hypothetical protein